MIDHIDTDRLTARPLERHHFDDLVALHADPAVMATLGGRLWNDHDNHRFLDRMLDHWDRYGYGVWGVWLRDDGRFIGRAGLNHKQIDGVDEVELLYAFHADQWGRGIATECVRGIAGAAFGRLKLRDLVAFTLPSNLRSRRVMEKTGFTYERDFIHAALPHALYRRRAPAAP